MNADRCSSTRRDGGQAVLEFALALPVMIVVLFGVIQVAVIVRDQLAVETAARAGAREASASRSPAAAAVGAANEATALTPIDVATAVGPRLVTVTVTYVDATSVPLIGTFIPEVQVRADATAALEPP